jgi:hypothetical protein
LSATLDGACCRRLTEEDTVRTTPIVAAVLTVALIATGCGGRSGSPGRGEAAGSAATATGDFGDLKGVCRAGTATSSPAQGVTASEINLGVFTDMGFSKKPELVDAAKVFTSWCNDSGGVNGRKLVAHTRDAKITEVRQRMIEACREDFALVGGSAALDGAGVKDRLSCTLPDFPAQLTQNENLGSDLQLLQYTGAHYDRYSGYFRWLLKEAYPASSGAVGVLIGDAPMTRVLGEKLRESLPAQGATLVYSDLYPMQGISDWTPYAQAIKSKGVKGLVFYGDFASLAKLEQVLTTIGYRPDWIDANNNAYGSAFLKLAGNSLATQNNLADLSGIHPLEDAASHPAVRQVLDLYQRYAPDAEVTMPALRAFSMWLLFAKAAASCGDALTRRCVYDAARKETAWTGAGLTAPVDLSTSDRPVPCFNVVRATPDGWRPADFKPDRGAYRCDAPSYRYTGSFPKPVTLADVGKSMSDVT